MTMRARASLSALFKPELRRDTLSLFGSFFFCLLANYVGILLLVTALTGVGFAQSAASNALGLWNVGGVAGAILGAILIQRFGSRITMLSLTALAIATAFSIAGMSVDPQSRLLAPMLTLLGGTLNAVQTTMYALAANIYPSEIRSTGIGVAVAIGRAGNVLASYTGNFALDVGGPSAFFSSFGMAMVIVFISLAGIRRHIGASATEASPAASRVSAGGQS
jgi:AAHS family 4-hydroxybenzoate transporter-like MFS transporter